MLQRVACSLILFAATLLSTPAFADIPERAEDVTPITVGESAPAFEVQGKDGETFVFDPASHDGKTMVIFYRGGWCPYCNRHLAALRDVVPALREAGVDVLFLSADKPELLYSSLEDKTIDYTLLSDAAMTASKAFGVAFRVDDETVERYKGFGIDLEAASGFDHHLLPVPAVYLIEDGQVAFMHADADYRKRLEPASVLAAAGIAGS